MIEVNLSLSVIILNVKGFHLYKGPGVVEITEIESRTVVSRSWGWGKQGVIA